MIPDLQSSILCDDVRQERNGKFFFIGVFDGVALPNFPAIFQRICIVNRWCCGRGEFTQQSRILQPDAVTPIVTGKEVRLALNAEEATATSVEFFINVRFETEGVYWIEILLEGDLKLRYPLRVQKIAPPPQKPAS